MKESWNNTLNDIKRKYKSWKWNAAWWLSHSHFIYINSLNFKQLYWPWYEVKDLFKKPILKCEKWYPAKWCIFKMTVHDLGWKTKYDEYRHEENPHVLIEFIIWAWKITINPPGTDELGKDCDTQYYETMLTWLYDDRFRKKYVTEDGDIKEAFKKCFKFCNAWVTCTGKDQNLKLTCKSCLTEKGLELIK